MPRPISHRIMSMRLPLNKDRHATIISVYVPTMPNPEENKAVFYSQLAGIFRDVLRTDKLLLRGDFNVRIGNEHDRWPLVMGVGKCNPNGDLILDLCSEFDLTVTNSMFKQKDSK